MAFKEYFQMISNLRTDKNRTRWSEITNYQAPHKPFLLLSVIDHFAQGEITESLIEPSFELIDTFNSYWSSIMPLGSKGNMAYPFPRLHNDGVWKLVPSPNHKGRINIESIFSMLKLRKVCTAARLNEDLFKLINQPDTREQLRATIIQTYFAKEIQSKILECGNVNVKAYEYSKALLKEVKDKQRPWDSIDSNERTEKVRDQGFRKAIVTLYEHRCSLCGIRMLTPEGHTIVDAAHVKPWSESRNDRPTNGVALCKLCHWSFDEGLMSVGTEYEVLVSRVVNVSQNFPGHILTLSGRNIIKPDDVRFWPGQENFEWHREKVYCD